MLLSGSSIEDICKDSGFHLSTLMVGNPATLDLGLRQQRFDLFKPQLDETLPQALKKDEDAYKP